MIRHLYGNHSINDHCWLNKTSFAISSGNLIKIYKYDGTQWLNSYVLRPFDSIILRISYYSNEYDINSDYLIVSGLQKIAAISLKDYEYTEFNSDFWILGFTKVGEIIVIGLSDLSVLLLKFPQLQLLNSFTGRKLCLSTSLAIGINHNNVDLIFTTINYIHHFSLSINSITIEESKFTKNLHRGIVFRSRLIAGKYLLTCSEDRSVILWSIPDLTVKIVLDHPDKTWDAIFIESLDSQVIATCDSIGNIYFWDIKGRLLRAHSTRDSTPITNLSTFDEWISSGSQDGNLRIKRIDDKCHTREFIIVKDSKDWIKAISSFNEILYIVTNSGHLYSLVDDTIMKLSVPRYITTITGVNLEDDTLSKLTRKMSKLKVDLNSYRRVCTIPPNVLYDRFRKTIDKFMGAVIRLQRFSCEDLTDLIREVEFIGSVNQSGEDDFTLVINERIEKLTTLFNNMECILQVLTPVNYNGDINLTKSDIVFATSTMGVCFDYVFIGDLHGQIHSFPISYDESDFIGKYKVFKCFQHRVGSIYFSSNRRIVCVDNLGNLSMIDYDVFHLFDDYSYIDSYKLPFTKRYGRITAGIMLTNPESIILGDEFGNLYYGMVPNFTRIKAHNDKITCIKYHNDSMFTTSTDGLISKWTLNMSRESDMKIEHLQHIYNILIDDSIHVMGFIGTNSIFYNLDGKIELWNHDCGGPRRPLYLSHNTYSQLAYAVGGTLKVYTCHPEAYSINPWFPYKDVYSGLWIYNGLLVGGRDGYIRLIQFNYDHNYSFDWVSNQHDKMILVPNTSTPISVIKAISFPCPIRCICKVDDFIIVGGAGFIKLYDNNLIELQSVTISDEDELLQIRVNGLSFIICDGYILLICGISNSTVHLYKITRNPIAMILITKIVLECCPLSIISMNDGFFVGTNRGFIREIKLDLSDINNYTERSSRIHQSGVNGIVMSGKYIITCGDDQELIVTDSLNLEVKFTVKTTNSIRCIGSQDQYIFTAGWDLILRVWIMNGYKLDELCKTTIVTRPRSMALKNNYSGSEQHIYIAVFGQGGSLEIFSFDGMSLNNPKLNIAF